MIAGMHQQALMLLIAWTSGISLYLTVALVGISGRMGWIDLPQSMEVLMNPLVIGLAILVYAVEFCADKIPVVDSAWDSIHTFIRPAGASVLGFMAGTEYGPIAQTAMSLISGTIALDTHAIKASSRLAINASPEPVTNIVASVTEDSIVIGSFWFFIKHPVLTVVFILLALVGSFFILRMLWKFVMKLFRKSPPASAGNVVDQEISKVVPSEES